MPEPPRRRIVRLMRALLLHLFPAWWRRRHGVAYRALLDQAPLTATLVLGVLKAAVLAWFDPRHSRLTLITAILIMVGSLTLLFVFVVGWNGFYKQTALGFDWRVVQFASFGYAACGLFVAARGHRVVGMTTVGVAALATLFQLSVGVPGWASVEWPLQVCVLWFMGLSCWAGWWAAYGVHDPRRRQGPAGHLAPTVD